MKKNMKKVMALALAASMTLGMTTVGLAQDATLSTPDADNATITVTNASKGETYSVYKLFDATVTGTEGGSIAYLGTIPDTLTTYFEYINFADGTQGVKIKDGVDESDLFEALKGWADGATAVISAESTAGDALNFKGLPYGYYVVTSTQDGGASITVNSTNPNVEIIDKNITTIGNPSKSTPDGDVSIGDTVDYTISIATANYWGTATAANATEQVVSYEVQDTLPEFLSGVNVTRIYLDDDGDTTTTGDQTNLETQQFASKKITIPWVDGNNNSLYKNGTHLFVEYTATVNDKLNVDGAGNENTAKITWTTDKNGGDSRTTTEKIYTYAAALQKVDETGADLAGAKFKANGLIVKGSAGDYTVVSYDPSSTTLGTEMSTDDKGNLIIKGLASDADLTVTETVAPNGYNKLTETFILEPTVISEKVTTTTKYFDAQGKEVDATTENKLTVVDFNDKLEESAKPIENKKGLELPSTGGMGTTIFYVLGSIMALGAGVILFAKKRMGIEE